MPNLRLGMNYLKNDYLVTESRAGLLTRHFKSSVFCGREELPFSMHKKLINGGGKKAEHICFHVYLEFVPNNRITLANISILLWIFRCTRWIFQQTALTEWTNIKQGNIYPQGQHSLCFSVSLQDFCFLNSDPVWKIHIRDWWPCKNMLRY